MYPTDIPPFQVKDNLPPKEASTPDIVLQAGHHFIVVVSGKVVLDHVFGIAPPQSNTVQGQSSGNQLVGGQTGSGSGGAASSQAAEAKPTKGNAKLEVGPLSVTALSFQYKDECLYVVVDATLQLGPLKFSVIEFAIKLELSKVQLHHLASVVTDGLISVSLHGIEVGVEQGPLSLEGVFIHDVTTEAEKYSGGIVVGFKAWQVLAIGQYMIKFPTATSEGFRAVFVYGKLDGPLVELEFATISGVRIGFGHNYAVRMPQIDELYKFPLICDTGASGNGNDPMKVLDAMVTAEPHFVYPKDGSDWFAAGMTITAFDVLTLTAVLVIDIDSGKTKSKDKGVILTLLADGVLQMEPGARSDLTLFYVEIVVSFEMNFVAGYIAANATLTPASHVYVPQAHLTGGASFYTWFGQNSHAGDWVVTLGGYARGYDPPAHYPRPNRIGLNFTVGDNIHITGSLYVAVTPKCAMAGGSLNMSLSVGPVSAWCDVMLDAFINFKPFHFRAQISLSVGVECDIGMKTLCVIIQVLH
ncbi:hypothetical protein CC80DRAFT_577198 [Byssothecium circinans]|uniref:DUF6603 domain-containing protein n=1 Tax=Byssothecium circinans TaxID=147558 RepID=A0A6A5TCR5_9PLEO|nr:hypothetical protein CC80DRAFT_577198 [Byssothecium circinans]